MRNLIIWKASMKVFLFSFFASVILGAIIPYFLHKGTSYPLFSGDVWKILIVMSMPASIAFMNKKRKKIGFKDNYFSFFIYNTLVWYKEKYPKERSTAKEIFLLVLIVVSFLLFFWSGQLFQY